MSRKQVVAGRWRQVHPYLSIYYVTYVLCRRCHVEKSFFGNKNTGVYIFPDRGYIRRYNARVALPHQDWLHFSHARLGQRVVGRVDF